MADFFSLENITDDQRQAVYDRLKSWLDETVENFSDVELININEAIAEIHNIVGIMDYDEQRAMLMYFFLLTFSSEFIQDQLEDDNIKSLDIFRKLYRNNQGGGWVH